MIVAILGLALAAAVCSAHADTSGNEAVFDLRVGGTMSRFDTDVEAFNKTYDIGGSVDLEDDLGLKPRHSYGGLEGAWRLAERHRLFFRYQRLERKGTATANRAFEYDDLMIPTYTKVSLDIDFQELQLGYAYAWFRRATWELSGMVGLHLFKVDTGLEADGNLTVGGATYNGSISRREKGLGPLPIVGIIANHRLTEHWALNLKAIVGDIAVNHLTGSSQTLTLEAERRLTDTFSVGAGITKAATEVEFEDRKNSAGLSYREAGARLYVKARF